MGQSYNAVNSQPLETRPIQARSIDADLTFRPLKVPKGGGSLGNVVRAGRAPYGEAITQILISLPAANYIVGRMLFSGIPVIFKGVTGIAAKGGTTVYTSVSKGVTQYVGITNNVARKSAEHLASKGINIQPLMQGLSRTDARAVEQALIEIHGLGRNGGTLLNKINSIAPTNPAYGSQLQRGYDLLKSIGY